MSLDDFFQTPAVEEYTPNPNTPPAIQRFTAKRFGQPVSGVIAPKDKHPDQVFIWQHDADGYAIGTAVDRQSLDELKVLD